MLNTSRSTPPLVLPRAHRVGPRSRFIALSAYATLALALGLWLALDQLAALLLAAKIAPLELGFWRLALAGLAFALHALLIRRAPSVAKADGLRLVLLALVGITAFYLAAGLPWGAPGGLAPYAPPLALVLALGFWLRRTEVPATPLRLINLGLVGLLVTLLFWNSPLLPGGADLSPVTLVLPLLLGISVAGYYRLSRAVLDRLTPLVLYALVLPLAALVLLPFVAFAAKTPALWLSLGLFAVLSSYGLHALYYLLLSQLGAPRRALTASAEAVAGALVALLLFAPVGPFVLLGTAVVAAAGAALAQAAAPLASRLALRLHAPAPSGPAQDRSEGAGASRPGSL